MTPACGPTGQTLGEIAEAQDTEALLNKNPFERIVSINYPAIQPGQTHKVTIVLEAQGNENALGFSLKFNPSVITYQSALAGQDAAGAALLPNTGMINDGSVGFLLALPTNQAFPAGKREALSVFFLVNANVTVDSTLIEFVDAPIPREIVDINANLLTARWTAVSEAAEELPASLSLHQNHPNPFNPSTTILYELPRASQVEVAIFDLLGKRIRTLAQGRQQAGQHRLLWDGRDDNGANVPSGVYLYRLHAGEFAQTRKMVFVQ